MKNISRLLTVLSLFLISFGCGEEVLEEELFSQLGADNYLQTEDGVETVLLQAYNEMQRSFHDWTIQIHEDLVTTGRGDGRIGAWEGSTIGPLRLWTWTSSFWPLENNWAISYRVIYNANLVLDNIDNPEFNEDFVNSARGEALALRAYAYQKLYEFFGPVPIHTSSTPEDLLIPRASEEEIRDRIESDYLEAIPLLPVSTNQYGRIIRGGAQGMLARFYLNNGEWQLAADMAQNVIDLGAHSLFPDFTTLFHVGNEGNAEVLWVQPCINAAGNDNSLSGLSYPPDLPFQGSQGTFPARIYIPDWFVDSYLPGDARADSTVLLTSYINRDGVLVEGYGNNQTIPLKYGLDPTAVGGGAGYDLADLRYADVLLMRAEALNELDGPTQESFDLINQVRTRAGIPDLTTADASDQSTFRDAIFQERQWEFHFENITRIDMIRQGTFISDAQARGISAQSHQVLYPIPQVELDANPNVEQNPGY